VFVVFLQSTMADVLVGPLATELGASRAGLEWAVNAFALAMAVVLVGAGAWTDRMGAGRVFLFGMWTFAAAAALAALAPSIFLLDAAFLAMGACAGLVMPSSMVLLTSRMGDAGGRAKAVGGWAAASSLAMVLGPLLAGWAESGSGWRAAFWAQGAAAVAVAVAGQTALRRGVAQTRIPARSGSSGLGPAEPRGGPQGPSRVYAARGRFAGMDVWGQATVGAAFGGLVFALVEAADSGLSGRVWTGIAVFVGAGAAAVLVERRAAEPLMPPRILGSAAYLVSLAQGVAFNFAYFGLMFAVAMSLQHGRGLTVGASALVLAAMTGATMAGNLLAAALARRAGGARGKLAAAWGGLALSLAAVAWTGDSGSPTALAAALAPTGLAGGFLVPTLTSNVLATVPARLHGTASAVFNTIRAVGSAVGVAVFGLLLGPDAGSGFGRAAALAAAVAAAGALAALVPAREQAASSAARSGRSGRGEGAR
jgi:DHA2 family methylenomycin A resistance protein-like MFS transporter